jgi:hypothetical protein
MNIRDARNQGNKTHLLDNADQNIGNGTILVPVNGGIVTTPDQAPRILLLQGPSQRGQMTSVVLTASRSDADTRGYAGPVTGIIEFGNGGQATKVEVDVPYGPFIGQGSIAVPGTSPQDGGVIVTVPTATLQVWMRYDNRLIQLVQYFGTPPLTFAQLNNLSEHPPNAPATPMQVRAMVAYFSRHYSKAYRTHYLYIGDSVIFAIANNAVRYAVPPFATSVQVLRLPTTAAMTISFGDGLRTLQTLPVPASTCPVFPLTGTCAWVELRSATNNAADMVTQAVLSYEIGV